MNAILLPTYLGTPKFDEFVEKFCENVMLSDLVKHFLLLAKKPALVRDLNRYWPYLLPKTLLEYRKPAVASSDYDIRLPESQFSEVVLIMAKLLREMKFNVDHAPQLIHEILELIEETRSQASASSQALQDFCSSRLAGYKRPRQFVFLQTHDMPRTATGKIVHRHLRQKFIDAFESQAVT